MAHFAELESKTDPTGFTSDTHLIVKQVYVIDDEHESDGENWCKNFSLNQMVSINKLLLILTKVVI